MTQTNAMQDGTVQQELHELADSLASTATWRDAAREVHFRAELEAAMEEADRGELVPQAKVEEMFLGE